MLVQRKCLDPHQRGNALRSLGRNRAGEDVVGQQQRLGLRRQLRQQLMRALARRFG